MTVRKKRNSSQTWGAILAGRKALQCGLIRRIGNGENTNIWQDRWIPGAVGGKPICQKEGASAMYVSELLAEDGRSWNETALNQNLLNMDAQAVKCIPLGRSQDDFWAWSGERHGLYSVRSAYRMLATLDRQERDHGENRAAYSVSNNDPFWRKLGKAKVPPKVRVFWWRVSHDFIPCRENLCRRHLEPMGTCVFCGNGEESTFHALTQCTFAVSFWDLLRSLTGIKLPRLHPETWARDLLDDSYCPEADRGVLLCGMWSLWCSRNDRRHGKAPIDPRLAIKWALETCMHLSSAVETTEGRNSVLQPARWSPPVQGTLKINSDGAYLQDQGIGATGAVVRDSNGALRAASARWLGPVGSALIAEAEAIRDGLRLIPEGTLDHIQAETDAQELVSLWKNRAKRKSEIAAILNEIEELASGFTSFTVQHVRRDANFAAHSCARFACTSLESHVWLSPASFLQRSLQSDRNEFS